MQTVIERVEELLKVASGSKYFPVNSYTFLKEVPALHCIINCLLIIKCIIFLKIFHQEVNKYPLLFCWTQCRERLFGVLEINAELLTRPKSDFAQNKP